MKHFLKISILLALVTIVASSCSDDDDYSLGKYWVSYGNIAGTQGSYTIVLDDGAVLNIASTLIPHYVVTDGERVIANYTILGDAKGTGLGKAYNVRLNGLYEVLSKKPVYQSFIDKDTVKREDSIGYNPIDVVNAWFGGKYLNINFEVMRNNSSIAHFINLVYDNEPVVAERGDSVFLTLRHNAEGDQPYYYSFGRVSFDISGLVPETKNSVPIKLFWKSYNGKTYSDTGTYQLNGANEPAPSQDALRLDQIATTVE